MHAEVLSHASCCIHGALPRVQLGQTPQGVLLCGTTCNVLMCCFNCVMYIGSNSLLLGLAEPAHMVCSCLWMLHLLQLDLPTQGPAATGTHSGTYTTSMSTRT